MGKQEERSAYLPSNQPEHRLSTGAHGLGPVQASVWPLDNKTVISGVVKEIEREKRREVWMSPPLGPIG